MGRPDLCYRVNEMQRACSAKATVQDLKNANKVVELALQGSDLQITFKSDWIDWSDLAVVTFSDASFANEEGFKSQQGRIHYITNASSLKEGSHKMHLISFGFNYPQKGVSCYIASRSICSANCSRTWRSSTMSDL